VGVSRVTEQFERRRSSFRDGKIMHTRAFLVTTDNVDDGTAVALTAVDPTDETSIPAPGEWLILPTDLIDDPNNPGQKIPNPLKIYPRITGIDADVWQNSSNHFQVLCEYTVPDPNDPPDNPLDRPVELSYTYNEGTERFSSTNQTRPNRTSTARAMRSKSSMNVRRVSL
jgi:hypothetical protein